MDLPENYNPIELVLALRKAKAKAVKTGEAFKSALHIDTIKLSDHDKYNLEQALAGEFKEDGYYHWICNNFIEPIKFETSVIALENAESQKRALETRVLYDIYRRTGIKLQAPHKDVVQII